MAPLPPLNALRAFESAARHLSFTRAAAELSVTPAAVSHQVKALEDLLQVRLFDRLTRALRLTEAGQAALPAISQAFASLALGVEQMRAHSDDGTLTISISPSFGATWLVPRLERFRGRHPEIEVRIDGTDRLADLTRGEADVAVRLGFGGYPGMRVDRLFQLVNTPVCSPVLLRGEHPLRRPEDLRHHTLLHIDWTDADATWRMWLLAAGLRDIDPTRGPSFNYENMAIQAAREGLGVALVGSMLVADDLAAGRLVRPFASSLSRPLNFAYYLLSTEQSAALPKIEAFRTWMLEEARAARPEEESEE